jgi:LysR family transcriptional regulator, hydrogen peroxide-inducible genes activator
MDLSQVTLSQMRYALAVQASQNFRAAAQACGVSQSGLSMQLHKLEDMLGVVLFDRSKKPVVVTPEGQGALAQIAVVVRETDRLAQVVSADADARGVLRVGVIPSLSASLVPLFLGPLLQAFPNLGVHIEELQTSVLLARLQADTVDVGIAATPLDTPGLNETRVGLEPMFAYLPPGDPLLKSARLRQEDVLARGLWVMPEGHCFRTQVLSFCSAANQRGKVQEAVDKRTHFESASFETLIRLVDGGLGATILPALVANGLPLARCRLQLRSFVGPAPVRELGVVVSRRAMRRRVTDALVAILHAALVKALGPSPKKPQVLSPQ